MSKVKTSNATARRYVQSLVEFRANNLWSEWVECMNTRDARYVVYSYDRHWPLFIYDVLTDTWFENASKYGTTTSKHKSQANPLVHNTEQKIVHLHVDDMIKVASDGCIGLITGAGVAA
jgi:hypothetical protein